MGFSCNPELRQERKQLLQCGLQNIFDWDKKQWHSDNVGHSPKFLEDMVRKVGREFFSEHCELKDWHHYGFTKWKVVYHVPTKIPLDGSSFYRIVIKQNSYDWVKLHPGDQYGIEDEFLSAWKTKYNGVKQKKL